MPVPGDFPARITAPAMGQIAPEAPPKEAPKVSPTVTKTVTKTNIVAKTKNSSISENVKRTTVEPPDDSSRKTEKNIEQAKKSILREMGKLVKDSGIEVDKKTADTFYLGGAIANIKGLKTVAPALDMVASSLNVVTATVTVAKDIKNRLQYTKIKNQLKADKQMKDYNKIKTKKNLTQKEKILKTKIEKRKKARKKLMGKKTLTWMEKKSLKVLNQKLKELDSNEKAKLERAKSQLKKKLNTFDKVMGKASQVTASVSYFAGSVTAFLPVGNVAVGGAGLTVAGLLGSVVFGAGLAVSKAFSLKEDFSTMKEIKKDIASYSDQVSKSNTIVSNILEKKIAGLKQWNKTSGRISIIKNSLDFGVGVSAAINPFTAAAALPISLATSVAFKTGVLAIKRFHPKTSARTKLGLKKFKLTMQKRFTKGENPKLENKIRKVRIDYIKARAMQRSGEKNEEQFLKDIKDFANDNSDDAKKLKIKIADKMALFGEKGQPDPEQIGENQILTWIGTPDFKLG